MEEFIKNILPDSLKKSGKCPNCGATDFNYMRKDFICFSFKDKRIVNAEDKYNN